MYQQREKEDKKKITKAQNVIRKTAPQTLVRDAFAHRPNGLLQRQDKAQVNTFVTHPFLPELTTIQRMDDKDKDKDKDKSKFGAKTVSSETDVLGAAKAAPSVLEKLKIQGKWALTGAKQNILILTGVGKGLAESGWSDIQGLGEFLSDPVKGLKGLQTLISSEEARAEVGDAVIASLNSKINNMRTALTQGGDENAELLGKELGSLIWQVGSVVTGVAGAAKAGVTLAKVGVNVSKKSLDVLKTNYKIIKSDGKALNNTGTLNEVAKTVVSSSSKEAVGHTGTTQVGNVVAKGLKGNKDFKAALGQFKNTNFTNAGRAVTKHPEYFGFKNTEALRKAYNTEARINKLAADTLKDIMRTGKTTTGASGRYPDGWKTITAPDGRAASWRADGQFIGFRGVQ